VAFGIRKQIQAQHGMAELQTRLEELKRKKMRLENREIELKSKIDAIEKKNKEKRKIDEERRTSELEFLKYQETHLSTFLQNLQDSPGSK
jgi:dynein light intermediate chain